MAIALMLSALLFTVLGAPAVAEDDASYTIHRAGVELEIDGRLDETAWVAAPGVGRFLFPWWTEGEKEQTVAKLLWDDEYLYAAFVCEDAHIWAEHVQRDSAVYRDDCVEVFTVPNTDEPRTYYNIEMNALGIFLDQFHPQDAEKGKNEEWNGEGIRIATSIVGTLNDEVDEDQYWVLEAAIPLRNFVLSGARVPPVPGDEWRLNLNRCGGKTNEQYSQWQPSQTDRPSFHQPLDFGRVIFSSAVSPF